MKQKVVIKLSLEDHKSRSKALKIAVGVSGVESAALNGVDKIQIEVSGDGMDAVVLIRLLRKKIGYAELVSVANFKTKPQLRRCTQLPQLLRCMQLPQLRKMVIKVSMNSHKSRSKALKIAVGVSGVESVVKGDDMNQIEVMGGGVDAVALTALLRKMVGYAELVSVGAAGAGNQSIDDEKNEANPEPVVWPNYNVVGALPHYNVHDKEPR